MTIGDIPLSDMRLLASFPATGRMFYLLDPVNMVNPTARPKCD
jgi:hypothetical protein